MSGRRQRHWKYGGSCYEYETERRDEADECCDSEDSYSSCEEEEHCDPCKVEPTHLAFGTSKCETKCCGNEYVQTWTIQVKGECSLPAACCVRLCLFPVFSYTGTYQSGEEGFTTDRTGRIQHQMPPKFASIAGECAQEAWESLCEFCEEDIPTVRHSEEEHGNVIVSQYCSGGLTNPAILEKCKVDVGEDGIGTFRIRYLKQHARWTKMVLIAECETCEGTIRCFSKFRLMAKKRCKGEYDEGNDGPPGGRYCSPYGAAIPSSLLPD